VGGMCGRQCGRREAGDEMGERGEVERGIGRTVSWRGERWRG
jgi:hypothetical protein